MMQAKQLRLCTAGAALGRSLAVQRRALSRTPPAPGIFTGRKGDDADKQTQSHSSMLSDGDYLYELQRHKVKPGELTNFTRLYEPFSKSIASKLDGECELVGAWRALVGDPDRTIHVWRYTKGYESLDKAIQVCMEDKEIRGALKEHGSLLRSRDNCVMKAFSYWGDPKPRPPGHVYDLRSYVLKPGQMIEWGNNWVRGIGYRRDFNQDVGGWFSQIGQLYVVYHLWAYQSLAHRKTVREHTWSKPGWDTNVAYTVPLIRKMRSTMLYPLGYSPLK